MKSGTRNAETDSRQGTGMPSDFRKDDLKKDQKITDKYTEDDQSISGNVRTNNPNRNVDKEEATNAGGYRN